MSQRVRLVVAFCACLAQLVLVKADECRSGYFERHPGYRLQGHVLRSQSSSSIWSCVLECRRLASCFSMNVRHSGDHEVHCELSKSSKVVNPSDYLRSTGYEYLEMIQLQLESADPSDACSTTRQALPGGWFRFYTSAYMYINEKTSQPVARQRCLDLSVGADLVSLGNQREMQFVKNLVKGLYLPGGNSNSSDGNEIWISLSDKSVEGTFVWLDGSPLNYQHWDEGEPNNSKNKEDCVIALHPEGRWNDVPCDYTAHIVCKVSDFRKVL